MTLLAAATLGDDIVHAPLLAQVLKVVATIGTGLLTGIAIGVAAAFIVGTGGLGAVVLGAVAGAVIGVAADAAAHALTGANSLDEAIVKPICDAIDKIIPGVVKGKIFTGSNNVYINSLKAARAAGKPDPGFPARQAAREAAPPPGLLDSIGQAFSDLFHSLSGDPPAVDYGFIATEEDKILCSDHPPMPDQYLAQGSSNVFINGSPAVRASDKSTCEGKVSINPGHAGRRNVSIGGDALQVRAITSEMPPWLERVSRLAGLAIGLCSALRGQNPLLSKLLCFGTNFVISTVADATVRGTAKYLSGQMGHPVHIPTGNKVLDGEHDQDFDLAAHLPLSWVRTYNAHNPRTGLFGRGWSVLHDVELRLNQPDPDDPAAAHVFIDPMGRSVPLPELAPGEKFFMAQEGMTFAHTSGGNYMLRFADGQIIDFGQIRPDARIDPGHPTVLCPQVIEDRNGNAHFLRYDAQDRLTDIATYCGLHLSFAYDDAHPKRILRITQHLGRSGNPQRTLVSYAYDDSGRLIEVRNPQGHAMRRFAYNSDGLMIMQRLPQGLEVHYRWAVIGEERQARVIGYHTNAGEQVELHYDLAPDGSGQAHSLDQLGRRHAWAWDALQRVTRYTDPLGGSFHLEWDEAARFLLSVTNPEGGVSRFIYDDRGNLATETDPLQRQRRTVWHSDLAEPKEHTGFDGKQWSWHYDGHGNLICEKAPDGSEQRWVYDRHGLVTLHTDARGGDNSYGYDSQGRLARVTDCSQRTTRYAYDEWGHLIRSTDAAGHVTEYRYNDWGQLTGAHLPDGTQSAWHWREDGLPDRQESVGAITRYEWDKAGRQSAVTGPTGSTTRWQYDSASRATLLTDGQTQSTRFEYDAADRLVAQTGIDGLRTEYRYDACGRPILVTQAAGTGHAIRIALERDALGRLTAKTTLETCTRYTYNEAGQLETIRRYRAEPEQPAHHQHNPSKQNAEQPPLLLDEIAFAYDEPNRRVTETSITYCLQQPIRPDMDATSWMPLDTPRRTTLEREYDVLGNPLRTVLPGGQTLGYLYYGSGHLHQIRFGEQVISDIERDALHREIARSQGALHSTYQLDPLGRLLDQHAQRDEEALLPTALRVHITDPRSQLHKRYRYSPQGHLATRHDPLLGEQTYQHDAAGQILKTRITPSPANAASFNATPEDFQWDAAGNTLPQQGGRIELNRVTVWQDIRYRYDEHGRLIHKQAGSRSSTHLRWNAEHQLIASTTERRGLASQTCRYHYDALGRRIAKTDRFGTTWFVWDGLRMVQEQRGSRCISTVYENADSHAPLARIEHAQDEQEIDTSRIYYYHTDINGAPEELTSHQGRVVWHARYRTWGNTVMEEWDEDYRHYENTLLESRSQNLRFQGQYLDRESGLHYNTFRYYDPDIGRFISQDPIGLAGGINLYQYAPNPISWIDPWGWCELKWGNPKSKPTYGHTFLDHTSKLKPSQLIDRARSKGHQVGQWLDDKKAAEFIAETARGKGSGVHDVPLPDGVGGRSFLGDGSELRPNMARIVVKDDGSVRTAFPFSSEHPN